MRWMWLVSSFLGLAAVLGAAGPTRAQERDLAGAIELALQEATHVEEDFGTTLIRGTPLAKRLRRGKQSLQKGLGLHQAGKWKGAQQQLARGIGLLIKAFREEGGEPGLLAVFGVAEEIAQWVDASLDDLEDRAGELPDSRRLLAARRQMNLARSLHRDYLNGPASLDGLAAILNAYPRVGKAAKKIAKLESADTYTLAELGKVVPGDLPPHEYIVRWWVNGEKVNASYVTYEHPPKTTKKVLKQWMQQVAEARQDDRTCTGRVSGTAFDGNGFTVAVVMECPQPGGGTETVTVDFTIEQWDG